VPGYWQWDDERGEFLWVSGVWRNPPPARKWVPGSWRQTEKGWQWSDGFWAPEQADSLEYLPPPPASVEEGPTVEAPSDDSTYVPGLWVYRETRYLWRPGYWLRSRPGWVWNPSYYLATPAGYLYVSGCWDYPLERRGLLFAPVCFNGGVYPRAWSPSYAVSFDFLPSALFVRSGHRHYYYGDYFTAGYRRGGYTPWIDFSLSRGARDPLYGYYRTVNAGRPWERDVRTLYTDRFAGRVDRPPRTLERQNIAIRNTTNVGNVTVLRPLSQSAPPQSRLVEVDRGERNRHHQAATQLRTAAVQRVRTERELVVNREAPTRAAAAPKSVKIDVPRTIQTTPAPRIEMQRPLTPSITPHLPAPRIETQPPITPAPHQPPPRVESVKPKTPLTNPHQPPVQQQPPPRIEPPRLVTPPTPVYHPQPKPLPAPKPVIQATLPRIEAPRIVPPPPPAYHPQPKPLPAPKPVLQATPRPAPAFQSPPPAHRPTVTAPPAPRPAPAAPKPASRPVQQPQKPRK
jgi:hypothetical protein